MDARKRMGFEIPINMNAKLNNEITTLAAQHKWQELLRKLPIGEPVPLVLDSALSINNLRSVAARLNSMNLDKDPCRYSFSGLNYETKAICALASPKTTE